MRQLRRYIPESWKRITTNFTTTINALMELQVVFYRWYVIFTDGYTDEIYKDDTFFWRALSVCKSISIFLIDGLINNP
jgi:hypothetical protein